MSLSPSKVELFNNNFSVNYAGLVESSPFHCYPSVVEQEALNAFVHLNC